MSENSNGLWNSISWNYGKTFFGSLCNFLNFCKKYPPSSHAPMCTLIMKKHYYCWMIVCFVCAFVVYTGKKVKPQFSRYIPIFCTDLLMANWITACRGSTLDGPKLIQWVFLGFFVRTNCDKEYYKNRQLQCCNVSNFTEFLLYAIIIILVW